MCLKTGPLDIKKLSDVLDKSVVKNTKFNKLNTKVNNLKNKIPDATTLINKLVMLRIKFLILEV